MPDIQAFLNCSRACLIAPAGYGKTHFIVDCMREAPQKQLILTHTHAGVASLREKLSKEKISPSQYTLRTISSLAKDFFLAYADTQDREIQEDSPDFFDHAVRVATKIVSSQNIQTVLRVSFAGIFVDEYQDCNIEQHEFITALSKDLPLRVLGDPMQGIFALNKRSALVSFDRDLEGFSPFRLESPKRWENVNRQLGEEIRLVRAHLESNCATPIDYSKLSEIKHRTDNIVSALQTIHHEASLHPTTDSCLIIPSCSFPTARITLAQKLGKRFRLLEAIDEQCFYNAAGKVDEFIASGAISTVYDLGCMLFLKTPLNTWFTSKGPRKKRGENDKRRMNQINTDIQTFRATPSFRTALSIFTDLGELPDMVCYRFEIWESLRRAIEESERTGLSVLESMKAIRNRVRLLGRKNYRLSIGSTLLTKGQEFDHVIIVNKKPKFNFADELGRKHYYVAISRARKSVLVIDVTD